MVGGIEPGGVVGGVGVGPRVGVLEVDHELAEGGAGDEEKLRAVGGADEFVTEGAEEGDEEEGVAEGAGVDEGDAHGAIKKKLHGNGRTVRGTEAGDFTTKARRRWRRVEWGVEW